MNSIWVYANVAGVTFEGRQEYLKIIYPSDKIEITPEPTNKYDKNALAVHVTHEGTIMHVGYIPKELSAKILPFGENSRLVAEIVEITGGYDMNDGTYASIGLRLRFKVKSSPDSRHMSIN